jgi:uncharacterized protein
MKVRFDDIPEEGLDLIFTGNENTLAEALGAVSLGPGLSIDPKVAGSLRFLVQDEDVFAVGQIQGRIRVQCSRCLNEFGMDSDVEIHLTIHRGPEPLDDNAGEEDVVFVEGPEFDPGEIILHEILLAIPMKPLCSEECPGLCPHCGALKGSPECTCPEEEITSLRWEALGKLKKEIVP